jgi:hypothetical protein
MKQFLQIRSLAPGIARRSSEWFQLRWAITLNPCIVCGIRGYRTLCSYRRERGVFGLSIGPQNLRQSMDFSSAPARVFFTGEKPPLLYQEFVRVLRFPIRAGPPSLSPHLPAATAAWSRPPAHGPGGARPRGGGRADLVLPCAAPSSLFYGWKKKMRWGRRWQFCNLVRANYNLV